MVCTTIIETGIDIPNVEHLVIIEDADKMGLAQLPSAARTGGDVPTRRAYAYLTYRRARCSSEVAAKRLRRHSGVCRVRLRLQDRHARPEIRGCGQSAGPEQSGS